MRRGRDPESGVRSRGAQRGEDPPSAQAASAVEASDARRATARAQWEALLRVSPESRAFLSGAVVFLLAVLPYVFPCVLAPLFLLYVALAWPSVHFLAQGSFVLFCVYAVGVSFDYSEKLGHRKWDELCTHPLLRLVSSYFSMRLVRTAPLPHEKRYVFVLHPAGVTFWPLFLFNCNSPEWVDLFPGITARVLVASVLFWIPLCREFFLWCVASALVARWCFSRCRRRPCPLSLTLARCPHSCRSQARLRGGAPYGGRASARQGPQHRGCPGRCARVACRGSGHGCAHAEQRAPPGLYSHCPGKGRFGGARVCCREH
jgi:hypothetical protein